MTYGGAKAVHSQSSDTGGEEEEEEGMMAIDLLFALVGFLLEDVQYHQCSKAPKLWWPLY